jgi:two-component system CheB/CheR fusion protein
VSEETLEPQFETLLQFLRQTRGFDFTGYKRPSLMRRVTRRVELLGMGSFADYQDYLQVRPEEFEQLFNSILINVTSFFRDPPAWEYLAREIVPALLRAKPAQAPVRVWSAGCASGEEAYSLAMTFAEAMGAEEFKERVKIYATDADEEALAHARAATYGEKDLEAMDPALRKRYFEPIAGRWVFRGDLRRSVIFGRHDIVHDAPISRLDLLSCRNTLMYFNADAQSEVLRRFHFALNGEPSGQTYLFLGRAEMMLAHGALFTPAELKFRLFARIPSPVARLAAAAAPAGPNGDAMEPPDNRLREQVLEDAPMARIVVDANGMLAVANQRARTAFSINPRDLGRPLQDLEISYRPLELRSLIEQAYAGRRSVTHSGVERRFADGEVQFFDVVVMPFYDDSGDPLGVSVSFIDVTRSVKLQEELRHSREEVQTTNEELQSSNEELETTNEELQSSNEELETTNEELQSTNEELETMNEELQSTNEELQTVNEELRERTEAVNLLNAFLESVLASLTTGAVVVNDELNVLMWNERAHDLWGLDSEEVKGRSVLNLDIGLPVTELRGAMRAVLAGESERKELILDAVNRRGKKIRCKVSCTPLVTAAKKRGGVILIMEEAH